MRHLPDSTDGLAALAPLARIQLVAIDIDGTLLEDASATVTDVVASLRGSLRHRTRGVELTIATGRAFAGARPVIERLQLPRRTPVILYNGSVVASADGEAFDQLHAMDSGDISDVVERATRWHHVALVYEVALSLPLANSTCDSPRLIERVYEYAPKPVGSFEFNGLPVRWSDDHSAVSSAAAIVIPTPAGPPVDLIDSLANLKSISVTRSSNFFLEVRPAGANKGVAVQYVASKRSLPSSAVLAIGDSDNDLEMLRWAGCSVAVANSTDAVLSASDYVTRGAAGEGVVETLRLLYDARKMRRSL